MVARNHPGGNFGGRVQLERIDLRVVPRSLRTCGTTFLYVRAIIRSKPERQLLVLRSCPCDRFVCASDAAEEPATGGTGGFLIVWFTGGQPAEVHIAQLAISMLAYALLSRPDRSGTDLDSGVLIIWPRSWHVRTYGAHPAARPERTNVVRVHSVYVQLGGLYLQIRVAGPLACQPIVFDFFGRFPTCCVGVATVRSAHARTVHLMLWDSVPWVLRPGNRASIAICQVEPDRFPKHILMVRFRVFALFYAIVNPLLVTRVLRPENRASAK